MNAREKESINVSILYMYMFPSRQSDLIILNGLTLNHHAIKHTQKKRERNLLNDLQGKHGNYTHAEQREKKKKDNERKEWVKRISE